MRKLLTMVLAALFALGAVAMTSCTTLTALTGTGGYGNPGIATAGRAGQFNVQLVECLGNASSQSVTAVMAVTNTGPNAHVFIGGSSDGSAAIDSDGAASRPYNSAGKQYDLPSGVVVRVEIDRIEPVRPGTPLFQSLRISLGSSRNTVNFRNVPIVWTN